MAEHFRGRAEILRFIEYMDVGESNGWRLEEVVPASEILAAIEQRWPLESLAPSHQGEVASRWAYRDGQGEIGVIHSVTPAVLPGVRPRAPVGRGPPVHLSVRQARPRSARAAARRRGRTRQ